MTGQDLHDLIVQKWGYSFDVQFRQLQGQVFFQVMWRYLEQVSFPMDEAQYLAHLDEVATYLVGWGQADHVRQVILETRDRPRLGKAVSILLDLGERASEWLLGLKRPVMNRFSRTAQALSHRGQKLRQDALIRDGVILLGLWGVTALLDLIWFQLDQAPPAWDQGDHLNRALEHWRLLQGFQPFDASWWRALWELSPGYRAPLVYLVTAPFFWLFGPGYDQAMAVNTLFTGVLIFATYGLGRTLFDRATGLWAALLCPWLPMLVATRLDYLLDYGLTASVLLFFYSLTQWRQPTSQPQSWGWTVGAGIACGLAVLAKFTSAFFLLMPLIWCGVESLMCKRWLRLVQLLCLVGIAILVFGPWFQVNWLTVLTSGTTSNTTWIPAGVNPDNPLSVWSYYLRVLPRMISWPLLWAAMGGLIIALVNIYQGRGQVQALKLGAWIWLWVFMGGAYGLLSLLQNKDPRHIMPYLPVVLLALVRATLVGQRRSRYLRPITAVGLSGLMVLGMFPVIPLPAWAMQRPPDRTAQWPHTEVVSTILAQAPYMKSVLGVIPNTAQLNPMNFDFYGKLADFQVFGREVSLNEAAVDWDAHALDWFVAKSGEQGPDNGTGQAKPRLQEQVANSPDYAIAQTWPLPDESTLFLYHRRQPMLTVATLPDTPETAAPSPLSLSVTVPQSSLAAGETWPVQYDIFGDLAQLETGVLILTWEPLDQAGQPTAGQGWTQDHGVGFGLLNLPSTKLETRAPGGSSVGTNRDADSAPNGSRRLQPDGGIPGPGNRGCAAPCPEQSRSDGHCCQCRWNSGGDTCVPPRSHQHPAGAFPGFG
jgi:4-amino-4-deoxy-L-arabinose transferase-like glycosyltransferase